MPSAPTLPGNWVLETDRTTHHAGMGRDYTTVVYREAETRSAVYINEVIAGDDVWRYRVHHSGRDGDVGVVDDLESAREMALAYIEDATGAA